MKAILLAAAVSQSIYGVELPPPQFDGAPPLAPITRIYQDLFTTDATCRAIGLREVNGRIWGCAYRTRNFCLVFLPNRVPRSLTEEMDRHETAHCAGWIHN